MRPIVPSMDTPIERDIVSDSIEYDESHQPTANTIPLGIFSSNAIQ